VDESRCGVTDLLPHQEIPVKVTAWVDEGVAPLVTALNEFERVMTVDSCQGDAAKGAYVLFSYRGEGKEAACVASDLGRVLAPLSPEFLLQAEWRRCGRS
jgi:hypothetical protein